MKCSKSDRCFTELVAKMDELEARVHNLRVSRQVLLGLVEKLQREKLELLDKLELENKKLKKDNIQYAKRILEKNRQIFNLTKKG
ncbi:MAG: translation initiation factor 2 [Bacillota bacterium]|nr:translation initiation factor 2 [Bacillota bacterium]